MKLVCVCVCVKCGECEGVSSVGVASVSVRQVRVAIVSALHIFEQEWSVCTSISASNVRWTRDLS